MNRFQRRQTQRQYQAPFVSLTVADFNEREQQAERDRYLESIRQSCSAAHDNPLARKFYSTFTIPGFREWFKISNLPVRLNRHTTGITCMTRVVLDRIARIA